MRNLDQMVKDFILEAREDSVGLWRVVNAVRHESGIVDESDVRAASLKVIEHLLNSGVDVIDYYHGRGWAKWPEQGTQAILTRVQQEWVSLGRDPNFGEICWFALPKQAAP